jgi:hypothetical protein
MSSVKDVTIDAAAINVPVREQRVQLRQIQSVILIEPVGKRPPEHSESDRSRRCEVLEEAPVVRDQQHCARVNGERIFKLLDRF